MKKDSYLLYERQEASAFEESYLLGNGTLGASVFSSPTREVVFLNHDTLWSGYPRKGVYRGEGKRALDRVKGLMAEKRYLDADRELSSSFASYSSDAYLPMGELYIDFADKTTRVKGYKRTLDLSRATVSSSYKRGDTSYRTRVFVSHPNNAMIYQISSDGGRFSLTVGLSTKLYGRCYTDGNRIYLEGEGYVASEKNIERTDRKKMYSDKPEERGMRFLCGIELITDGKTVNCGDSLSVIDASYIDIRLCAETSYNGYDKHPHLEGKDYQSLCKGRLDSVVSADAEKMYRAHISDFKKYFDRFVLDLGSSDKSGVPTTKRLELYEKGEEDKALPALLFNFGRYLTVAASRAGSQPMNLQGIWNHIFFAPWHSNYTTNINAEMNYFPTLAIGLPEMFLPFIKFVEELSVRGRDTAKYFYGAEGWVCHHNTDIWRHTHPVAGSTVFSFWNAAGAWMCHHLYEYYQYTLDEKYLRETAYPIMREAARFYLSQLTDDDNGERIIYPSTSPENYYLVDGERVSISETTEMTMACVRELFGNYIRTCDKLAISDDITDTVRGEYPRLRPIKIGGDGRIVEWYEEKLELQPTHRHLSHLYALYPGNEVNPLKNNLRDAFVKSLEVRGDEGTGWSLAWKCNLFARLLDGDHALSLIKKQLRKSGVYGKIAMVGGGTYPNMTCAHPPFQIDGNFGVVSGICEMLLQSDEDTLHLCPACPSEWRDYVKVSGIRAKGDRRVNFLLTDGILKECEISGTAPDKIYLNSKDVTDKFVKTADGVSLREEIELFV